MTTAPRSTAAGARVLLTPAPTAKRAMSTPAKASGQDCSTFTASPRKRSSFPTLSPTSRGLIRPTGKFRDSRFFSISVPTAPMAPATATVYVFII